MMGMKLATTVGHFLNDLDFENIYNDHLVVIIVVVVVVLLLLLLLIIIIVISSVSSLL